MSCVVCVCVISRGSCVCVRGVMYSKWNRRVAIRCASCVCVMSRGSCVCVTSRGSCVCVTSRGSCVCVRCRVLRMESTSCSPMCFMCVCHVI